MKTTFYLFLFSIFLIPSLRAESFEIDAYDVKVQVSRDGYFDVTEIIYARFTESSRGIFRTLPLHARVDGESFKMHYSEVSVENWNYTKYDESGNLVIRIGDADIYVDGRQRYVIKYRVTGSFLWYDDHSEFYWNLVGNKWPVPIKVVTYSITFPEDVYFTTDDYGIATGPKGNQASNATIERSGQTLHGMSTIPLEPNEGMSVGVRLAADAIMRPQGFRKAYNPTKDYLALIPAMFGAFIVGFWRRFGRNPRDPEDGIVDEYYPPENLSAAMVGTLFDHKANNRDVIALLPEWGNQGLIRMRALQPFGKDNALYIERVGEVDPSAPEYERLLFQGLFREHDEILVSDLSQSFHSTMSRVKKSLKKEVLHEQLYDMRAYRMFHQGKFILLFLLGLVAGIVVIATTGLILTGVLIIALGVAALVIHLMPPKRSTDGMALQYRLKGLRNFLRDTPDDEIDRLLEEDPDYFSRMLPYAIAFGLDSGWINLFQSRPGYAPHWWYYGDSYVRDTRAPMNTFSEGFDIQSVSSAFTSVPASSGSSGGGGFSGSSGGGFGGGGGGSW